MRAISVVTSVLIAAVAAAPAFADTTQDTVQIEALRQQIRGGKTEVIANVMSISDASQAAKFWELYRGYEGELNKIGDKRLSLVSDYLKNYSTMSNDVAASLIDRTLDNQEAVLKLRRDYAHRISREISPVVAARFLQIEGFTQKYIDLQIDSALPLVKSASATTLEQPTPRG